MTCSEQSGGIVVLLGLAIFVGATVDLKVPAPEPECYTVTGYKYVGRDENGRPDFDYPVREICR